MAESIKTTGIVLKSSKHTIEAARLLEIFSPEMGKFSAVIRGVEKPKAKLAVASQPFCFGEFVLVEKNGYYTVTDCFVHDSFFDLTYNLDAYVLGVDRPLTEFQGTCIAIIHRTNDDDDKLIVVPDGINLTDDEIEKMVSYQEKWFKHIIIR